MKTIPTAPSASETGVAAAVASTLQQQLGALAPAIPDPALAGPLAYFAAASGWAASALEAPQRAINLGPVLDSLRADARALLRASDPDAATSSDDAALIGELAAAAAHGVPEAQNLLAEFVAALRVLEDGPLDAPDLDAGGVQVGVDAVSAYLRQYHADPNATAHEVNYLPGGFSKTTILVSATIRGERRELVLRQVPDGLGEHTLAQEYAVLSAVAHTDLPIPKPLWIEETPNSLGGSFFACTRVPGAALGNVFGVEDNIPQSFAQDLAEALARLHTVAPSTITAAPRSPMRNPAEIQAAIDALETLAIRAAGPLSPRVAALLEWLRANIPTGDRPTALLHGDMSLHNVLAHEGRLTALLDWELSHLGDPAEDLAFLRQSLEPAFPWEDFVDRYVTAGGVRPDPAAEHFYTVWQETWRHIYCLNHRHIFLGNRSVPYMVAGVVFSSRFLDSAIAAAFGVRSGHSEPKSLIPAPAAETR
ncbi:phosphotransferase family protein [Arthrobacter sp. I2-34]|uniref:Phosphotransferase family protein n=1 Tax=Arthrobacter hankyongi TaxID=2904801 RepID=A0ABS9L3X1_9MICC|nr:phosphotransferase family protein [Arthrobacter hankyongi]MCG2621320.1 phosphotransferase family protein [Arthrobacter hankyongi]